MDNAGDGVPSWQWAHRLAVVASPCVALEPRGRPLPRSWWCIRSHFALRNSARGSAMRAGLTTSLGTWEEPSKRRHLANQIAALASNKSPALTPPSVCSQAAVSLAWLQRFVAENRIRERGLNSVQLVKQIINPRTSSDGCRFFECLFPERRSAECRFTDWMLRDPDLRGAVSQGRPFFFVSHTWSRPFAETLDMVVKHFEPERQKAWRRKDGQPLPPLAADEVFVWFDMFAVVSNDDSGAVQQWCACAQVPGLWSQGPANQIQRK